MDTGFIWKLGFTGGTNSFSINTKGEHPLPWAVIIPPISRPTAAMMSKA